MKGKQKGITLRCVACNVESPRVVPDSPAAPILTACEQLHDNHGWSYQIGFETMLTGDHQQRCADGSRPRNQAP
jgi:hypothetical protein